MAASCCATELAKSSRSVCGSCTATSGTAGTGVGEGGTLPTAFPCDAVLISSDVNLAAEGLILFSGTPACKDFGRSVDVSDLRTSQPKTETASSASW
eukprot:1493221-Prymnesium_polylepis.1